MEIDKKYNSSDQIFSITRRFSLSQTISVLFLLSIGQSSIEFYCTGQTSLLWVENNDSELVKHMMNHADKKMLSAFISKMPLFVRHII